MMTPSRLTPLLASAALAALTLGTPAHAAGINWASVPGKKVVLFYPGQAAWEWALTPKDMSGATKFIREGKTCFACHEGEEQKMGAQIVTGKVRHFKHGVTKPPIEPTPIAGKPGSVPAVVKFANDGENLYVHLDVKTGNQPNAGQDKAYATKVTVMFSAAKTPDVIRGGCFAACHNDMTGMPYAAGATRTNYLGGTRARLTMKGGGDTLKPAAELAKLKAQGYFFEDWQARLNQGKPATAASYVVFDKRSESHVPLTVAASYANGTWSVTMSSKLNPGDGLIGFRPGQTYTVAFAVHAGHTDGRFHYISLERSLTLNSGSADFVALKK